MSEEMAAGARGAGSAGGARVTVYTRVGCPACEKAEADVARICGELGQTWQAVDVDGREHGYWKVEEPRFRGALARSTR